MSVNDVLGDQSWRTEPLLRQTCGQKIEDAIRVTGNPTTKTVEEMENHLFLKARTKEEYFAFAARLILHVQEMIQFANEADPALTRLTEIMKTNWIGCIQFTGVSLRIMIIIYLPQKRMYMGFVPHNQKQFYLALRENIEAHKRQQLDRQQQMLADIFGQMTIGLDEELLDICTSGTGEEFSS